MPFENLKEKEKAYGDLFTVSKNANLWNELYDMSSESLFYHNMALRRDHVCKIVVDRYRPGIEILDLGCGAGVVMEQLIQKGFRIAGVDRSQDMLDLSQKRLSKFPPNIYELHLGTCESLPFANDSFDVILCVGVFGYIDDVVGALLEIRRVLRPGGLLIISVRNPLNSALSDPVRVAQFFWKRFSYKLSPERDKSKVLKSEPIRVQSEVPAASLRPLQFRIDILQNPVPLIRGVTSCGYELDYFSGFGFGPFNISGKKLFSEFWSIKISNFLNNTFSFLGLQFITRRIGDVSIYGFVKTAD